MEMSTDIRSRTISSHMQRAGVLAVLLLLCLLAADAKTAAASSARTKTYETVRLCYNSGKLFRKVRAGSKFPGCYVPGATMCGWSTKRKQSGHVQYVEGQKIPGTSAKYYMVVSSDLPARRIKTTRKYTKLYMVGDSRTEYMKAYVGGKKTAYVYKNGGGLSWFLSEGYGELLRQVRASKPAAGQKQAVVLCLGYNDAGRADDYIDVYNRIAPELKKERCALFVMSINPVDSGALYHIRGGITRTNARLMQINKKLKKGTADQYQWIDTWSAMLKRGWHTYDGVHYRPTTYQLIYQTVINTIG